MSTAHRRKKQPELVRRALLDCAAHIAVEQGLANVSVQAVAGAAGVTKGGLFHHFASKHALVDAVFEDLLEQWDRQIDGFMAGDEQTPGCFTRAYVAAVFMERDAGAARFWRSLCTSMVTDAGLRRMWSTWLERRLARHRKTDAGLEFAIVRLAADGAWLAFVSPAEDELLMDASALRARLIDLTWPMSRKKR